MNDTIVRLPWEQLLAGLALLVRISAFVAAAPVIGADTVPARVRIGFALILVMVLWPVVPAAPAGTSLVSLAASESLVGLLLGFSARLVLEAALVAGTIGGLATGISMASMLDPVTQASSQVLAILYRVVGSLVFCAIGGHHAMLGALARSYELVPIGGATLRGDWVVAAAELSGRVLVLGLRISAPVLVAGLLADVALMLIARAVPQMNILVVGAPVRLVAGLVAVACSLQLLVPVVAGGVDATLADALRLIGSLAERP